LEYFPILPGTSFRRIVYTELRNRSSLGEDANVEQALQKVEFDEYGLLRDPGDWTPELAQQLAVSEGVAELTDQHWAFLGALRDYYSRFQVPPPTARICHELGMRHGCGHELFPSCLAAWRIAGLPDPGEEAKSYLSGE
jgi:tRNA 2-thiouridine synthesizing protein E